jgi:hypothetical protein
MDIIGAGDVTVLSWGATLLFRLPCFLLVGMFALG